MRKNRQPVTNALRPGDGAGKALFCERVGELSVSCGISGREIGDGCNTYGLRMTGSRLKGRVTV